MDGQREVVVTLIGSAGQGKSFVTRAVTSAVKGPGGLYHADSSMASLPIKVSEVHQSVTRLPTKVSALSVDSAHAAEYELVSVGFESGVQNALVGDALPVHRAPDAVHASVTGDAAAIRTACDRIHEANDERVARLALKVPRRGSAFLEEGFSIMDVSPRPCEAPCSI